MKLVDTSVWIRFFKAGQPSAKTTELRELIRRGEAGTPYLYSHTSHG
jgi:hypothetical protein